MTLAIWERIASRFFKMSQFAEFEFRRQSVQVIKSEQTSKDEGEHALRTTSITYHPTTHK